MSHEETQLILDEVRALRAEIAELRILVSPSDGEREYREDFVAEMSEARADVAAGEFVDAESFLKQLAS